MRPRVSVYIATTVDGFIARSDGGLDWLEHDSGGEDYGYADFVASVDLLLMGRKTFEAVLGFGVDWPYTQPVAVLSHTLSTDDIPADLRNRVSIVAGAPADVLAQLGEQGATHIWLDGGEAISAFVREGLVDRLILTRIPLLIGTGIPLFSDLPDDVHLRHERSDSWPSGLVQTTWAVASAPD